MNQVNARANEKRREFPLRARSDRLVLLRISEVLTKEANAILTVFSITIIAMKNISDLSDLLLLVIAAVSNAQIQRY